MPDAQPDHELEHDTEPRQADEWQGPPAVPQLASLMGPPPAPSAWTDPQSFLHQHYGLAGELAAVGGDAFFFLLHQPEATCRLDFTREPPEAERFHAEAVILSHLRLASGHSDIPDPLAASDGALVVEPDDNGTEWPLAARLLALPQAQPAARDLTHGPAAMARIGTYIARMTRDLEAVQPPEGEDDLPVLRASADLRQAGPAIVKLLRDVTDPTIRDPIAKVMVAALRRVQPLGPELRTQLIHHHLIGADLIGHGAGDAWQPSGFADTAALGQGWTIAALAGACAELVDPDADGALDILPAVRAFHAELPLLDVEVKALWPLTVARIGLLRSAAERQASLHPQTAGSALEKARMRFEVASGIHPAVMEAALFDALEWPVPDVPALEPLLPGVDASQIRIVDLSVESSLFAAGNFEDPEIDWRLLARTAWDTQMGATRFGEFRLSRSLQAKSGDSPNFALHVDLCLPAGAEAHAPMGGMLHQSDGKLVLAGKEATLHLEGLDCVLAEDTALFAGDRIGVVAGSPGSVGGLRIRLCREPDLTPPLFATQRMAGAWRRLALSPSSILGLALDAPVIHATSPVRGWRDRLFDGHGRAFVDLSGAAGLLGYGHPAMAEAAYHQWLLLNGLAGTKAQADYRDALLARMPAPFDTVVALTDGMQAMDLATTLAHQAAKDGQTLRIADERRTGFGRLGHSFFQFERDEETPDIIVTGSPVPGEALAAVITTRSLLPVDFPVPPMIAGAVACRIATAVLEALHDDDLRHNALTAGMALHDRLQDLLVDRPSLVSIEGEGLAIDLVLGGIEPMDLARAVAGHGVLLHATDGNRVALTAPLCLSLSSIDRLAQALETVLPLTTPAVASLAGVHEEDPLPAEDALPM